MIADGNEVVGALSPAIKDHTSVIRRLAFPLLAYTISRCGIGESPKRQWESSIASSGMG